MWQRLVTFILSDQWLLTPLIETRQFRVGHEFINPHKYQVIALIALAAFSEDGKIEIFKPQKVQPSADLEILQFPAPPKGWRYSLAAKQILLPRQSLLNWNLLVDMPVVDLNPDQPPINPTISTTKNATSVTMNGTTPVRLLPVNTTNSRKNATFYNPSTLRSLIIDTDSTINTASAVAKVAPGKIYISDIPEWQGEYWGVLDGTGTPATAVEEYL